MSILWSVNCRMWTLPIAENFLKVSLFAVHAPRHSVQSLHPKQSKLRNLVGNKSGLHHQRRLRLIHCLRQPPVHPHLRRGLLTPQPILPHLRSPWKHYNWTVIVPWAAILFSNQVYTTLIFPFPKQNNKIKLHQVAKLYSNIHTILTVGIWITSVFQKFNFQGSPSQWTMEENGSQCHKLQHLSRS